MTNRATRAEYTVLLDACTVFGIDPTGARLVSASSRLIWHVPNDRTALAITRPRTKTAEDVNAEAAAVRAAVAARVRTPTLLADPIALGETQFALAYQWVDGRPLTTEDWPAAAQEAAKIAHARPNTIRALSFPSNWPEPAWERILGEQLLVDLGEHIRRAETTIRDIKGVSELVLCHGDLQSANILVDHQNYPWLIDLEYACLSLPEWDPAKIVVLVNRFGDPPAIGELLTAWPALDSSRLTGCISAQETQIVAWLVQMALDGTPNASEEAIHRAATLHDRTQRWQHLR